MNKESLKNQRSIIKHFLRVSLTGKEKSPSVEQLLKVIKPQEAVERILAGLKSLDELLKKIK